MQFENQKTPILQTVSGAGDKNSQNLSSDRLTTTLADSVAMTKTQSPQAEEARSPKSSDRSMRSTIQSDYKTPPSKYSTPLYVRLSGELLMAPKKAKNNRSYRAMQNSIQDNHVRKSAGNSPNKLLNSLDGSRRSIASPTRTADSGSRISKSRYRRICCDLFHAKRMTTTSKSISPTVN